MSYTNETMPNYAHREYSHISRLDHKLLETKLEYFRGENKNLIERFRNLVDACKEYGYVNIQWDQDVYTLVLKEKTTEQIV